MQLSNEHITQFQTIYKKNFGKDISKEEALEKALKLVRLMEIIFQPYSKQQIQTILKETNKTLQPK